MPLALEPIFARHFAPRDRRELDEWAREHVRVGAWSPWEGRFSTDRTPWIIEPLRILGLQGPRRETIVAPAAGGKSTIGEVFLSWAIKNAPGFAVWYAQDEEAAKEFAETRVQRFLDACDDVRALYPINRHLRRTQAIHFPHMSFVIQAANLGNVQSKHIRHMICDETHLWAPGMLAAAHKRTTRFAHNRTILELSTGSEDGDETDQAWHQGTRQEWRLHCPKCGNNSVPKWSGDRAGESGGVKWDPAAKRADGTWDLRRVAESAGWECPICSGFHAATAANGWALNAGGDYTAAAADAMPAHWSFHWNCIASDFAQLGAIAVEFLQAKAAVKRGTTELLREFTQKKLAEAWKEELPEIAIGRVDGGYNIGAVFDLKEELPLMVVDVQQSHFWALIRAFNRHTGHSRLIDCARLESWESVRAWQVAHNLPEQKHVLVDSGHVPDAVYRACCLYDWFALKGEAVPGGYLIKREDGSQRRVMARKSDARCKPMQLATGSKRTDCALFLVSDQLTSEIMARCRDGEVEGWTIPTNAPDFYRKQLASMVRVPEKQRLTGQTVWVWKQIGSEGNHLWDCERYALAAAFLGGAFRITNPVESTTGKPPLAAAHNPPPAP